MKKVAMFLGLLALLAGTSAYAQIGGSANIGGSITDDSGAALPGVTVTVTNRANGRSQALVTGGDGRYRAVALQPGPYQIEASLQGFGTVRREITLVVGADASLDLKLGVASVSETVTVVGVGEAGRLHMERFRKTFSQRFDQRRRQVLVEQKLQASMATWPRSRSAA